MSNKPFGGDYPEIFATYVARQPSRILHGQTLSAERIKHTLVSCSHFFHCIVNGHKENKEDQAEYMSCTVIIATV